MGTCIGCSHACRFGDYFEHCLFHTYHTPTHSLLHQQRHWRWPRAIVQNTSIPLSSPPASTLPSHSLKLSLRALSLFSHLFISISGGRRSTTNSKVRQNHCLSHALHLHPYPHTPFPPSLSSTQVLSPFIPLPLPPSHQICLSPIFCV